MKTLFKDRYNQDKFIVGMVHTLAMPGSPMYDRTGGMRKLVKQAKKEAKILRDCGYHSVMYCNESDMPYMPVMAPETVAAMTDLVAECQAEIDLPFGINMLIDPIVEQTSDRERLSGKLDSGQQIQRLSGEWHLLVGRRARCSQIWGKPETAQRE